MLYLDLLASRRCQWSAGEPHMRRLFVRFGTLVINCILAMSFTSIDVPPTDCQPHPLCVLVYQVASGLVWTPCM